MSINFRSQLENVGTEDEAKIVFARHYYEVAKIYFDIMMTGDVFNAYWQYMSRY